MGWDIDRFPEGEVNLELICCICTCILEDPVESPCRHVFCSQCIKTWLSNQKSCPHCRAPVHKRDLQSVVPLLKNIISKQKIFCDNKNRGCNDIIALENLQGHIASCPYGLVACTYEGCHVRVMRKDHKSHVEVCAKRTVMCENGCEMFLTLGEQNTHNCVQSLRSHFQDVTNELLGRIAKLEEIVNDLASKNNSSNSNNSRVLNNQNHHGNQHRGGGGGGNNRGGLNDETYSCVSYNIPSPRSYNSESSPTRYTVLHEVDNTINLDNYQNDNNSDYSVESVEPDSPLNNHHNTYINPPRSPTGARRNSVNYDPEMSPVYGGVTGNPTSLRGRGGRRENHNSGGGHSSGGTRHRSRSPTAHRQSINNRNGLNNRSRRQQIHSTTTTTTTNFDDDYSDGLRNSSQQNLVGGANDDNDDGLVLRIGVSQTVSDSSTSASSTSDSDTD